VAARRTIRIDWLPRTADAWNVFSAVRMEAGQLWSWLVERHGDARQQGGGWPGRDELQRETKRQFPNLHSQSVQMIIHDFLEAVASAESLRKRCEPYEYPHKVMEVRLDYGCVEVVCRVMDEPRPTGPIIGIDLGVNTVIAATDGEKAVLVSGREIKATIQLRNKQLAEITAKQSGKIKGSRRHKRLQCCKYRMLDKAKNKVRDLCHKATRKVADVFPNAKAYVGRPFNDACRKMGRRQAQTVSSACNRKLIALLSYKLAACIEVDEAYSSQTCPVCGERSKHGRTYRCGCGLVAPRDAVGCSNIRAIGIDGEMRPGCCVPNAIQWIHPSKYPGINRVVPRDTGQVAWAEIPRTPAFRRGECQV
jgi:hypothetical protein